MAGPETAGPAMGGPEFEAKLDELLEDYRHVVWQSFQLPFFSLMPTLIILWHYLIALFGILVELVLLPYTLIALLLRLFKVRWKIIAPFSKRFWYMLIYISRGEIYGSVVIRPVVRWLVKSHIARRLRVLGELVATSEHFPKETRVRLGEKIAEAQARFPVRELTDFFKDSLIPALVFGSISFVTDMVGGEQEKQAVKAAAYFILGFLLFYGGSIVIAGFPIKRGLLLGREAKRAAFPGGVKGQGLYGLEREIFSIFPVRPKEISLDFIFYTLTAAVGPAITLAIVLGAFNTEMTTLRKTRDEAEFALRNATEAAEQAARSGAPPVYLPDGRFSDTGPLTQEEAAVQSARNAVRDTVVQAQSAQEQIAVTIAGQLLNYALALMIYVFIRIRRGILKRS